MSLPGEFQAEWFAKISELVAAVEALRVLKERADLDSSLLASPMSTRPDLLAYDLGASKDAVGAVVSAYDSGGPPAWKVYLLKII